ncbi:MAG TPA: tRNA (adenosine(37)-N6)-threonylcarbamoyltransferase complex transferase subunit TsaD [Candidatus Levybacteria bacterium]|nr:tRNA (adenosine(37)-N6)-threonylcarbamoyltransferase complex transferase subunit TsaD [Candidatus Levybacteria bacterium]
MRILSIETSCDETSAAVVEKNNTSLPIVISSSLASSSDLHALTGGIIPEKAARAQLEYILPIICTALLASQNEKFSDTQSAYQKAMHILSTSIDAIAITHGPGLIGSLLIGIETAKTLSVIYNKPLIPVNHLLAHLYANFITTTDNRQPSFPFIGLIVSGGHTDLLYFEDHGKYTWIGGTRDDAAGEAMDKIGRVLNLQYPAGPEIEKQAKNAKEKTIRFSRALKNSDDFDFSFSGLKTEAARYIQKQKNLSEQQIDEICYAVQDAVADVLVYKTLKAAEKYNCQTILLGGGVSANEYLTDAFKIEMRNSNLKIDFFFPEKKFTSDNAAMIGAYAALNYSPIPWQEVTAHPELHLI